MLRHLRWHGGFLLLLLGMASVQGVDLRTLVRTDLGLQRASHTTSEVGFARQVGQTLHRYSSRTGLEGCADLCQSPQGAWSAQAVSIGSHTSCSTLRQCPAGYRFQHTVHSHPIERRFEANAVDFALRQRPYQAGVWWEADDPRLFSEADYQEPGYLAVQGGLWFQRGRGTEVYLGPLRDEEP